MCSTGTTGMLQSLKSLAAVLTVLSLFCAPPGAGIIKRDGMIPRDRTGNQEDRGKTLRFTWDSDPRSDRNKPVEYRESESHSFKEKKEQESLNAGRYDFDESTVVDQNNINLPVRRKKTKNTDPIKSMREGDINQRTSEPLVVKKFLRYKVKSGDTLYGISRKYNCTPDELYRLNHLKKTDTLLKGTMLNIPRADFVVTREKKRGEKAHTETKNERPSFSWPVKNILQVRRDGGSGVKPIGVEITGRQGSSVVSAAQGVVKKVGEMRGYGKYIIISHAQRYITVYASVKDIMVAEGEKVSRGSIIARVDADRRIIFQIGRSGKPVDPLRLLPDRG